MKAWYQSRTMWLLIGQLCIVWASYFTKEASLNAVVALSLTTVGGMIMRYYTDAPMRRNGNNNTPG